MALGSATEKVKILILGDSKSAERAFAKANTVAVKSMKSIATVGAASAAAFVAYSVKSAAAFEASVSDLSAITGATGRDLDFLRQKSLEFGSSTTLSATQAAEAFKLIASAKPDLLGNADALAKVTRETITLSEAAGIGLPVAANALGSALNQFNAGAKESARFINVLAAGAKFGASEIGQTSEALKVVGTVASGVGLSFEQTNAAIQALAAVSLKGSQAGTGLRGVLLKLSAQTRDQFNPEVVGFIKAIKNLKDANLTTTEKTKLFGQESITAANALIKEADNLDVLTGHLTGTSTAYEQASIRVNNLEGDVSKASSALEAQAIMMGSRMDPSLRTLVQGFTSVISAERQTAAESLQAQANASDLAIVIGQLADMTGNAAKGIVLPFLEVGDAIGAVAAQISFFIDGDFKGAIAAGNAGLDSMIQRFSDITDPAIARRFEDIARGLKKSSAAAVQNGKAIADTTNSAAKKVEQTAIVSASTSATAAAASAKSTIEQLFQTTGGAAKQHFDTQVRDLRKQVGVLLKAGVSTREVQDFFEAQLSNLQKQAEKAGAMLQSDKLANLTAHAQTEVALLADDIIKMGNEAAKIPVIKVDTTSAELAITSIKDRISSIPKEITTIHRILQEVTVSPLAADPFSSASKSRAPAAFNDPLPNANGVFTSGSRATGGMIPRDGYYQLHAGERVVSNSQSFGDINITLPAGSASGNTDWRGIVRNIILPEIAAAQR